MQITSDPLCVILDLGILIFVALEFYESRATNESISKLMNKQRKQKKKVSADKIIKSVLSQEG